MIKIIGDEIYFDSRKVATLNVDVLPSIRQKFIDTLDDMIRAVELNNDEIYVELVDSLISPDALDVLQKYVNDIVDARNKAERTAISEDLLTEIEHIKNDLAYSLDIANK